MSKVLARGLEVAFAGLGEQDGGRRCYCGSIRDGDWQHRADPGFFGGIAAEFPNVFASAAAFDRQRLVSPGRTRARIYAADVLEDIRLGGRAAHFGRFAVVEIGHRRSPWVMNDVDWDDQALRSTQA